MTWIIIIIIIAKIVCTDLTWNLVYLPSDATEYVDTNNV